MLRSRTSLYDADDGNDDNDDTQREDACEGGLFFTIDVQPREKPEERHHDQNIARHIETCSDVQAIVARMHIARRIAFTCARKRC